MIQIVRERAILTFDCVFGVLEVPEVLLEYEWLARAHGVLGKDEEL